MLKISVKAIKKSGSRVSGPNAKKLNSQEKEMAFKSDCL